jgi:hypothetical protein
MSDDTLKKLIVSIIALMVFSLRAIRHNDRCKYNCVTIFQLAASDASQYRQAWVRHAQSVI